MIKGKTEGEMSMKQIHKGICNYWKLANYFLMIKWNHKDTNNKYCSRKAYASKSI